MIVRFISNFIYYFMFYVFIFYIFVLHIYYISVVYTPLSFYVDLTIRKTECVKIRVFEKSRKNLMLLAFLSVCIYHVKSVYFRPIMWYKNL